MTDPHRRLADGLRSVIESLQVVDLDGERANDLADRVAAIAEELAGRPHRRSWHEDPTLGLHDVVTDVPGRWSSHDDRSPIAGKLNAAAPPLWFEVVETARGPRLHGTCTLSATYEGAPLTAHGGTVCALFDEMLGNAQRIAFMSGELKVAGYTGTITTIFRAPTPTYTPLHLEAWFDRIEGRKILMRGTIHANDILCAEAEGIFVAPRTTED